MYATYIQLVPYLVCKKAPTHEQLRMPLAGAAVCAVPLIDSQHLTTDVGGEASTQQHYRQTRIGSPTQPTHTYEGRHQQSH
jgi:hypothetical protein